MNGFSKVGGEGIAGWMNNFSGMVEDFPSAILIFV